MYITKCPKCKSSDIKKNGIRRGAQFYKCKSCGKQFLNPGSKPTPGGILQEYVAGKQTIAEIAFHHHVSEATIKRLFHKVVVAWQQPVLPGRHGYVHLDATYWGHNWGIMLAIDAETGEVLYLAFIRHETTRNFVDAITAIVSAGYRIDGIIIDGKTDLFSALSYYPLQMCQFHMIQIVRRYLTKNPKLIASKELMRLCRSMVTMRGTDFAMAYEGWKTRWRDFLNRRTTHKDGRSYYLHRRLRTLVHSIDFYLPYLFTFQRPDCKGMPNTNNKIEGTFTDLKTNLNNHCGLTKEHRQLFITAYFLMRQKPSNLLSLFDDSSA